MQSRQKSLRKTADLADAGLIPRAALPELERVAARYAVAITPAVADLIHPDDTSDPIARQFVPDMRELSERPEETADPIGDATHSPVEGVVHRYPDRVLLKLTSVCATYCRFCFRRETVGPHGQPTLSRQVLDNALAYIAQHPQVWEVILSGGDPLVLPDRRLKDVVMRLAAIAHVKIIRIHTRMPVVDPERITPCLASAVKAKAKATYVVLHANHPRELSPAARAACATFVDAGIPLLSQTVLLRGVNDDARTLGELMRAFVECRIKPYYLHHCDLAPGTSHFRTTIAQGQELMRALRGRYSGLCQPTYVLDIPGGHGKSPIGPSYLAPEARACERYRVEDFNGRCHFYPPADPP
ncbi:MAG: lysine-2,3-aminomutase-like protein [Xanthobacteraceae bacterium]